MSESDSDDFPFGSINQSQNMMVSAKGPTINSTNISVPSFRDNVMSSTMNRPWNNERSRYAQSVCDQQRRGTSPMSLYSVPSREPQRFPPSYYPNQIGSSRSVYNGRGYAHSSWEPQRRGTSNVSMYSVPGRETRFPSSYQPNEMGSSRTTYNGRAGSPMSVRTINSAASMTALDIASIIKQTKFSWAECRVLSDAIRRAKNKNRRRKIEKRKRERIYGQLRRRTSDDDSGEQGSDSSNSSHSSRTVMSVRRPYTNQSSVRLPARSDIMEWINNDEIYTDQTNYLKNKKSLHERVTDNLRYPKSDTQSIKSCPQSSKLHPQSRRILPQKQSIMSVKNRDPPPLSQSYRFQNGDQVPSKRCQSILPPLHSYQHRGDNACKAGTEQMNGKMTAFDTESEKEDLLETTIIEQSKSKRHIDEEETFEPEKKRSKTIHKNADNKSNTAVKKNVDRSDTLSVKSYPQNKEMPPVMSQQSRFQNGFQLPCQRFKSNPPLMQSSFNTNKARTGHTNKQMSHASQTNFFLDTESEQEDTLENSINKKVNNLDQNLKSSDKENKRKYELNKTKLSPLNNVSKIPTKNPKSESKEHETTNDFVFAKPQFPLSKGPNAQSKRNQKTLKVAQNKQKTPRKQEIIPEKLPTKTLNAIKQSAQINSETSQEPHSTITQVTIDRFTIKTNQQPTEELISSSLKCSENFKNKSLKIVVTKMTEQALQQSSHKKQGQLEKDKIISKTKVPLDNFAVKDVSQKSFHQENDQSRINANNTDMSMRPSFLKRKLYTQKVVLAESENASSDELTSDSPHASVYGGILKEKNKTRKLVTQSYLDRDVDESSLHDLIHKMVNTDQSNAKNTTIKNVQNKKQKETLDVTIASNSYGGISPTYTDEYDMNVDDEVFNGKSNIEDTPRNNLQEKNTHNNNNKLSDKSNRAKTFWDTDSDNELEAQATGKQVMDHETCGNSAAVSSRSHQRDTPKNKVKAAAPVSKNAINSKTNTAKGRKPKEPLQKIDTNNVRKNGKQESETKHKKVSKNGINANKTNDSKETPANEMDGRKGQPQINANISVRSLRSRDIDLSNSLRSHSSNNNSKRCMDQEGNVDSDVSFTIINTTNRIGVAKRIANNMMDKASKMRQSNVSFTVTPAEISTPERRSRRLGIKRQQLSDSTQPVCLK